MLQPHYLKAFNFDSLADYNKAVYNNEFQPSEADVILAGGVVLKNNYGKISHHVDVNAAHVAYTTQDSEVAADPDPVPEPISYKPFHELVGLVTQWGKDRNIIGEGTVQSQFPKFIEEVVEGFAPTVWEYDLIKDGIGDAVVVMIQMAGIDGLAVTAPPVAATPTEINVWASGDISWVVFELIGQMGTAVAKGNKTALQGLYDKLIYIFSIKAAKMESSLEECLTMAYDEIKDRRGVLYKGAFVKSTDLDYVRVMTELGKPLD